LTLAALAKSARRGIRLNQQDIDPRAAFMTFDADYQRHRQNWIGFTQFVKYGTGTVILILVLMALFLL
jgi:aa3 type cytochrome c oxidase subunit IV